jgi:ATP-binding cassette subfamily G (WHITE) protein 2 (PDR)
VGPRHTDSDRRRRKRVTIAEAALSLAPLQCWDNSTRGLDSANAIDFCKSLRMSSDYFRVSSVVAIYQAPQAAYDVFDKVSVLYDGQQIFFGKTTTAKDYFVRMGWHCPEQQTVPDFLTSVSSPSERRPTAGYESQVPTSAEEFAAVWRASPEYMVLQEEISSFNQRHPINGPQREEFEQYRRSVKSKSV